MTGLDSNCCVPRGILDLFNVKSAIDFDLQMCLARNLKADVPASGMEI